MLKTVPFLTLLAALTALPANAQEDVSPYFFSSDAPQDEQMREGFAFCENYLRTGNVEPFLNENIWTTPTANQIVGLKDAFPLAQQVYTGTDQAPSNTQSDTWLSAGVTSSTLPDLQQRSCSFSLMNFDRTERDYLNAINDIPEFRAVDPEDFNDEGRIYGQSGLWSFAVSPEEAGVVSAFSAGPWGVDVKITTTRIMFSTAGDQED